MIFDIARPADILRIGRAAVKFVEDHLVGLGHHIGENVQPAAMGHPVDNIAHTGLAAIFDDIFQCRQHRFAAV